MIRAILVDDDEIICMGLRQCIPWEDYGIDIVGVAHDGEVALQIVEEFEPEIAIVDIDMPFIDGLEFADIVRDKYPQMHVIILTASKEFTDAQEAIRVKVFAYLTKPFSNADILKTVTKVIGKIEIDRKERKEISSNISAIKKEYLQNLITEGIMNESTCSVCGIVDINNNFCVAIIRFETISDVQTLNGKLVEDYAIVSKHLKIKLDAYCQTHTYIKTLSIMNRIIILGEFEENEGEHMFHIIVDEIMGLLQMEELLLYAGVGRSYKSVYDVHYSYVEANKAVIESYDYGNNNVVFYQEAESIVYEYDIQLNIHKQRITVHMESGQYWKVNKEIEDLFEKIKHNRKMSLSQLRATIIDLMLCLYKSTNDDILHEHFLGQMQTLIDELVSATNILKMEKLAKKNILQLCMCLMEKEEQNTGNSVNLALKYMQKNFSKPDLTLKEVAEEVHISANYLSSMFKEREGDSYINCLNNFRMEEAKKLLVDQDVKMYEIAFRTGFNSSQYFSNCFKKYTGVTPREYRSKHMER